MKVPDAYDTIYTLEFAQHELDGLIVRIRLTYGLLDAVAEMGAVDAREPTLADVGRMRTLLVEFSAALAGWNLTGAAGEPVGTDLASVRALDNRFVGVLATTLIREVGKLRHTGPDDPATDQAERALIEAGLPVETGGA